MLTKKADSFIAANWAVEIMPRVSSLRERDGDEVAALEEFLEADGLDTVAGHLEFTDVRVVGQDMESEGLAATGDAAGDVAIADQPDRLAVEPGGLRR